MFDRLSRFEREDDGGKLLSFGSALGIAREDGMNRNDVKKGLVTEWCGGSRVCSSIG